MYQGFCSVSFSLHYIIIWALKPLTHYIFRIYWHLRLLFYRSFAIDISSAMFTSNWVYKIHQNTRRIMRHSNKRLLGLQLPDQHVLLCCNHNRYSLGRLFVANSFNGPNSNGLLICYSTPLWFCVHPIRVYVYIYVISWKCLREIFDRAYNLRPNRGEYILGLRSIRNVFTIAYSY